MLWTHWAPPPHPVTPHLEGPFAKFVELWGPGLPVPPAPYPRAPDFTSLLISTTAASQRGRKPSLGSQSPVPAASPQQTTPHPVLSAHSCVLNAFQPLIKCLLYRAWAWSVCGGSRRLVGGTPALTAPGLGV